METAEQKNDDDVVELQDEEVPYTERIAEFLAQFGETDEVEPIFYLYKFDDPLSGKSKQFCKKYADDPPEQEDIGLQFGGGRFVIIMHIPPLSPGKKAMTKSYKIKLHPRFDELCRQRSIQFQQQQPSQVNRQQSTVDSFAQIERLIAIVTPLIQLITPLFQRPPRDESMQSILQTTYSSVNELLQHNLTENFKMLRDVRSQMADVLGEGPVGAVALEEPVIEKPEKNDMLTMLLPLLSEWLPKLLAGGMQSNILSSAIQQAPQFREILSDQNEMEKLIKFLVQTQGVDDTNRLLETLNINRRVARPVSPAAVSPAAVSPAAVSPANVQPASKTNKRRGK